MPYGPDPPWDISTYHYRDFHLTRRHRPHIEVWKSRPPLRVPVQTYQYFVEHPQICPKPIVPQVLEHEMIEEDYY